MYPIAPIPVVAFGPLLLLCLSNDASGNATVFKCQLEDGRLTFQESPCAAGQTQEIMETTVTVALNNPMEVSSENLLGKWCFFENQFTEHSEPEKVTLELQSNGRYRWEDKRWDQEGAWSLDQGALILSEFGEHQIVFLSAKDLLLRRVSDMKLRRGGC